MDSLKISKSSSTSSTNNASSPSTNKPSTGPSSSQTTVPITVRFNAGDEFIDDIFPSFHTTNTTNTSATNTGSGGGGGGGGGSATIVSTNTNNTTTTVTGGTSVGNVSGGGGDSLSTSPSQHHQIPINNPDEANTRNNFLQGNYFNRKRSGSIEAISPTKVPPVHSYDDLLDSDAKWQLVSEIQPKYPIFVVGGVGQGDLAKPGGLEFDSDQETKTSLSEDLSMGQDRRSSGGSASGQTKPSCALEDSDSELENQVYLSHSHLHHGFAQLKSKVKNMRAAHHAQKSMLSTAPAVSPVSTPSGANTTASTHGKHSTVAAIKKDISPSRSTGSSSSSTSLRGNFFRRRRNKVVEKAELASPTNMTTSALAAKVAASGEMVAAVPVVVSGKPAKKAKGIRMGKKDIEIESGVEMLEYMIPPPAPANSGDDASTPLSIPPKRDELNLPLQTDTHTLMYDSKYPTNPNVKQSDQSQSTVSDHNVNEQHPLWHHWYKIRTQATYLPSISIVALIVIFVLPLNDFIRGVLTCLLGITLVEGVWNFIQKVIERYTLSLEPEKTHTMDYIKVANCQIPEIKEYKTVKSYVGWMNEIDSYDPNTFNINMSRSVYIELNGTVLQLSATNDRIPKRVMWNELPINPNTIIFTTYRCYNLLDCRVELLPIGLARKRHFNRKYPIQLIIKDCKPPAKADDEEPSRRGFRRRHKKHEKSEKRELSENNNKLNESETHNQESGEKIFFETAILNADLQKLQDEVNPDEDLNNITVPCGDEIRLLLFARSSREKEDWYRRFLAASCGDVHDQDHHLGNVKITNSKHLSEEAIKTALLTTNPKRESASSLNPKRESSSSPNLEVFDTSSDIPDKDEPESDDESIEFVPDDTKTCEGLSILASAARNERNYIKFMSIYQKTCRQSDIPVDKVQNVNDQRDKKRKRRTACQENELWKGIDQSLYLGPTGSDVWPNVLLGRLLYSSLQNEQILEKLQDILQKKLNSIKLPSFMEDVIIKNIDLGNKPPLIHRVSKPVLDERGIWLDMDVSYEGHCHITVTTKMNLLRLKRPMRSPYYVDSKINLDVTLPHPHSTSSLKDELLAAYKAPKAGVNEDKLLLDADLSGSAIFDSDAESTGSSGTESDSPIAGAIGDNPTNVESTTNPVNVRHIFKFVERITSSNFFQFAADLPFVQKAMENMSTTITLGIDLRGLVSCVIINIPPPPSDRIWIAFRAPPRLLLTARPTVGDKSVDWSIVTNAIEDKLCEAINKLLVYPNMVDLTIPFLGKSASSES